METIRTQAEESPQSSLKLPDVTLVPELSYDRIPRTLPTSLLARSLAMEDLSPRSAELVELRTQLAIANAAKDNAEAEAAELRRAAESPAPAEPEAADPEVTRIVAAVKASFQAQFSSNPGTNRFNAAVSAMGSEKYSPKGKQTLEDWLRTVNIAFRASKLEKRDWGSALCLCLDSAAQSAVYAQLGQQDDETDLSFDTVVQILTNFYGAKETQSNQREKLESLTMQAVTMEGFQRFRDRFTELAAHVADEQLTALGRCRIILRNLPESLRLALVMNHEGEFSNVAELFEKARTGIQALLEVSASDTAAPRSYAKTAAASGSQQARQPKRGQAAGDSSGSEDSQRGRKQQRTDRSSRLGTGLPVVPGKTTEQVLALVRAGKCAKCEAHGHRADACPGQVSAFCCCCWTAKSFACQGCNCACSGSGFI